MNNDDGDDNNNNNKAHNEAQGRAISKAGA